jgi:thioredoxin-dependent peroxiredoxin
LTCGRAPADSEAVIAPGQKLDLNFRVKVWRGGRVEEVKFTDLLERRTIISVYMKNNTPSCDRQNESLAAHAAEFRRAGYALIAISRDTCGSHGRYAAAKNIDYPLVSDPQDLFARAADSVVRKSMYGRTFTGPARAAFVLDPDGTVLAVAAKVDAARHAGQLRELIMSL